MCIRDRIESGDLKNPHFDTKIIKIGPEMAEICQRDGICNFLTQKILTRKRSEIEGKQRKSLFSKRVFSRNRQLSPGKMGIKWKVWHWSFLLYRSPSRSSTFNVCFLPWKWTLFLKKIKNDLVHLEWTKKQSKIATTTVIWKFNSRPLIWYPSCPFQMDFNY